MPISNYFKISFALYYAVFYLSSQIIVTTNVVKHNCKIGMLGKKYQVEKTPNLKLLEIGFGCEHHVVGRAALVWKKYFEDVKYYGMDFFPWTEPQFRDDNATKCMKKFNHEHPNITEKVWFGDQGNVSFLLEVVEEFQKMSGGVSSRTRTGTSTTSSGMGDATWDIIIDDGGHYLDLIEKSFATLWPFVSPGGYYIVEDLNMEQLYSKHVVNWIKDIADGEREAGAATRDNSTAVKTFFSQPPKDMMIMGCANQICYYRKETPMY
eukprot:gene22502-30764_t